MVIGWLADKSDFGGAELSSDVLMKAVPDWAQIVYCPPEKRPPDVDAFVVMNCYFYDSRWIEELELKPVIKSVRDWWYSGDPVLRRWLLDYSELLLFNSPLHIGKFPYEIGRPLQVVPPPVDVDLFVRAGHQAGVRTGNVWLSSTLHFLKGVSRAIDWALRLGVPLDVYGVGTPTVGDGTNLIRYHGAVPYQDVPDILARYEQFVFMPFEPEPFCRAVVEAWAAGCKLVLGGPAGCDLVDHIGCLHWIKERPQKLGQGAEMFWNEVEKVLR